ncbi:MAG: hypothetical protein BJ554DRAFT_2077 [Olpidium bornovanus]|uniref:Uncharacterized protein n=1 Tax=Olpidium bornovanus TaxID=278681 RepID=A0A8H7ZRG5_9FUNG|nr:MAG: hypothetical protein BJ554DRAFT_2077 [Olpidium bornovanus]
MPERDPRLQPADAGFGQPRGGLRDLADDGLSDGSGPQLASSPCAGHDRGRPAGAARRGEEGCAARCYRCCRPPAAPGVPGDDGAAKLHNHHHHHHNHNQQWPPTPRRQIHHRQHGHASCDPAAAAAAPYATPTPSSSSGRGGGYPAASPSPAACSRMFSVSPTPKRRHPRSSGDRFILDRDCNVRARVLAAAGPVGRPVNPLAPGTPDQESGEIRTAVIKREMFGSPSSTPVKGRPVARRLFQAETARALQLESPRTSDPLDDPCSEAYNPSPVSLWSQRTVLRPRRAERKFSTSPYKVLDAPDLQVRETLA